MDYALVARFTREKALQPGTYGVALLVGTLINGYGHLLVPYLRGSEGVLKIFMASVESEPALVLSSIFLAYCFPFCVGVYSSVATRYRDRKHESRARFPDCKPDPVFRASRDGAIIEAGERTVSVFAKYGVDTAQQVLGPHLWNELLRLQLAGRMLPHETRVHVEAYDRWYYVGHSDCGDGDVNVYLTATGAPA